MVRRRRWLSIGSFAVMAIAAVLLLVFKKRHYRADTVLATVTSTKGLAGLTGLAASLAGGQTPGGFILTPDLVSDLALSRGVLLDVAFSNLSESPRITIIDSLTHGKSRRMPLFRIEKQMRDIVAASVNRKTGLITIAVELSDSALARVILERTVSKVSERAVATAHAQAAEQRTGLQARVDSAYQDLTREERALVEFSRANRSIAPYSMTAVQRDHLSRAVDLAQSVYSQALTDMEAARARELEETPAVVTVDGVARELTPLPRYAALISLGLGLLFFLCALGFFTLQDLALRAYVNGDPEVTRLLDLFSRRRLAVGYKGAQRDRAQAPDIVGIGTG